MYIAYIYLTNEPRDMNTTLWILWILWIIYVIYASQLPLSENWISNVRGGKGNWAGVWQGFAFRKCKSTPKFSTLWMKTCCANCKFVPDAKNWICWACRNIFDGYCVFAFAIRSDDNNLRAWQQFYYFIWFLIVDCCRAPLKLRWGTRLKDIVELFANVNKRDALVMS